MERSRQAIAISCDICGRDAENLTYVRKREQDGRLSLIDPMIQCHACTDIRKTTGTNKGVIVSVHVRELSWDEDRTRKKIGFLTTRKGCRWNELSSDRWRKRLWNIHYVMRGNNAKFQKSTLLGEAPGENLVPVPPQS